MLQSVLSLDSSGRTAAMQFLNDCATNFGLPIPEKVDIATMSEQSHNDKCQLANTNPVKKKNYTFNTIEENITTTNNNVPNSNLNENVIKEFSKKSIFDNPKETSNQANSSVEKFIIKSCDNQKNEDLESDKKFKKSDNELDADTVEPLESNKTNFLKKKVHNKKNTGKNFKSIYKESNENENGKFKCPGCSLLFSTKSGLSKHCTTHVDDPVSCKSCKNNFDSVSDFWKHINKKQCKVSLFKCDECGEKFKYRRHYLKHVLGHNDNNCRYCDEKFSTWVLYKNHLKEKHPDIKMERDLIPCKFCAMSFRRHLGLYNHYQVEHSKGKFVCLSCGLLLPTKEKYKEHSLIHESEKTWKCKICKMKFYRRQQLLYHVAVHKSGTYKCLTCDITVTSKVDLYKHKKDGHEVKGLEPKFECEICHKTFKKKVVLKNHMATHSVEKKYYCKYCVKSFRTMDALQKHQKRKSHFEKAKIVLPESKYEKVYEDKLICENCGKQYKTQRELTWHLRVHKSIYECNECGKTFTLKVNLTKHIRLHRNKVCVVCELCGNTFNQLSALNEHNLMKHSDVRNAECDVCKKKFKRKSELNRHKRIHEQKRPFVCFCGTAFKQSSHLQTHYKTFHEKSSGQNNLIETETFSGNHNNEGYDSISNHRKPIYVNGEQESLLPLTNIERETEFRNSGSYDHIEVNENLENKTSYINNYGLRYPQTVIDPINVGYEDINFGASQADKRELVFTSPAVDLSMVTIPEVVPNDLGLDGHRNITESVETYNKLPDDASNLQLVNLSEHIVQEYLLNLP